MLTAGLWLALRSSQLALQLAGLFLIIDTWAARAGELYRPPVYIALADGGGIHVSESLYSTKDDFASNGSARPLRCVIARRATHVSCLAPLGELSDEAL